MLLDLKDQNLNTISIFALQAGTVLLIIVISHIVITYFSKKLAAHLKSKEQDHTKSKPIVYDLVSSFIYWTLMLIIVIIITQKFGLEITAFLAVLGSLLLGIGLGIQGILGDFAAGVMLMLANTYKIGDYIQIESENLIGTVIKFSTLFTDVIDEDSGVTIKVPNRKLYESILVNHSSTKRNIVLANLIISNINKNTDAIRSFVLEAVNTHPAVLKDPIPTCHVAEITANGTILEIRYALLPKDFQVTLTRSIQSEIMTLVKNRLDQNNVILIDFSKLKTGQ